MDKLASELLEELKIARDMVAFIYATDTHIQKHLAVWDKLIAKAEGKHDQPLAQS